MTETYLALIIFQLAAVIALLIAILFRLLQRRDV